MYVRHQHPSGTLPLDGENEWLETVPVFSICNQQLITQLPYVVVRRCFLACRFQGATRQVTVIWDLKTTKFSHDCRMWNRHAEFRVQ